MIDLVAAIPERSLEGKQALDVFYLSENDANFYVEDEDQENLYFEILRKSFPDISITRIFPLGGKHNICRHEADQSNSAIPNRVYLVDKDFDDLLGTPLEKGRIIQLDKFCIENYFLEIDGLVELIIEEHPKYNRETVMEEVGLDRIINELYEESKDLFALYFIAQNRNLNLPNCSQAPETFTVSGRPYQIDLAKISSYCEAVNQLLLEGGHSKLDYDELDKDERLLEFYQQPLDTVVSGKHVLAMLFHKLKDSRRLGKNQRHESLKFRLAKNCNLAAFRPVSERISALLT